MRPVLSSYDFSTLYTTLHQIYLKINLLLFLKEPSIGKALLTLHVTTEIQILLRKSLKNSMHGLVKMYMMR